MKLGIPQIIMLGVYFMNIGINLARNGQSRENETYKIGDALIGAAVGLGLLYWGGFFS